MTLLLSSIAPAIFLMYMIYRHDHDREPIGLLLKCFGGGVLSIGLTLLLVYPFKDISFNDAFLQSFYNAFLMAALPEEFSKWIILIWIVRKAKAFDHYYDGIIYAVFVSLGFALIENILYVRQGGFSVAITRAVLAVPGHMLDGVAMGYFYSLAKLEMGKDRRKHMILSLLVPVLLHGIYDFILMYANASSKQMSIGLLLLLLISFVIFIIYLWRLGLRKIKRHKEKDGHLINQQIINNN
jgi:RsiW-degrading membrane proteinase PrsW (M82 family)